LARGGGHFGVPLAQTQAQIVLSNVSAPGLVSSGQYHDGNTFLFQETQTKLAGRHALRYGVELVRQLITQQPIYIYGHRELFRLRQFSRRLQRTVRHDQAGFRR